MYDRMVNDMLQPFISYKCIYIYIMEIGIALQNSYFCNAFNNYRRRSC